MTAANMGPTMAPPLNAESGSDQAGSWRQFDSSVNAISFGFVATAILISMFLVMAIFERFVRPRSPFSSSSTYDHAAGRSRRRFSSSSADLEVQSTKLDCPSPKMSIYAKGVSVLMPGNDMPTFIAHPAPAPALAPRPPERILWPSHHHIPVDGPTSSSS